MLNLSDEKIKAEKITISLILGISCLVLFLAPLRVD